MFNTKSIILSMVVFYYCIIAIVNSDLFGVKYFGNIVFEILRFDIATKMCLPINNPLNCDRKTINKYEVHK